MYQYHYFRIWDQSIAKQFRITSTRLNLDKSRSNMLDFLLGAFEKMLGAIRNLVCDLIWLILGCLRLFPEIQLEKILSIIDFEQEIIAVDGQCKVRPYQMTESQGINQLLYDVLILINVKVTKKEDNYFVLWLVFLKVD